MVLSTIKLKNGSYEEQKKIQKKKFFFVKRLRNKNTKTVRPNRSEIEYLFSEVILYENKKKIINFSQLWSSADGLFVISFIFWPKKKRPNSIYLLRDKSVTSAHLPTENYLNQSKRFQTKASTYNVNHSVKFSICLLFR